MHHYTHLVWHPSNHPVYITNIAAVLSNNLGDFSLPLEGVYRFIPNTPLSFLIDRVLQEYEKGEEPRFYHISHSPQARSSAQNHQFQRTGNYHHKSRQANLHLAGYDSNNVTPVGGDVNLKTRYVISLCCPMLRTTETHVGSVANLQRSFLRSFPQMTAASPCTSARTACEKVPAKNLRAFMVVHPSCSG